MKKNYTLIGVLFVVYMINGVLLNAAEMAPPGNERGGSSSSNGSELIMVSGPSKDFTSEVRCIRLQGGRVSASKLWLKSPHGNGYGPITTLKTALGQRLFVVGDKNTKEVKYYEYLDNGCFFSDKLAFHTRDIPLMLASLKQGYNDYLLVGEPLKGEGRSRLNVLQWNGSDFILKKARRTRFPFNVLTTLQDGGINYVLAAENQNLNVGVFDESQLEINWNASGISFPKITSIASGKLVDNSLVFVAFGDRVAAYSFNKGDVARHRSINIELPFSPTALSTFAKEEDDAIYLVAGSARGDVKVLRIASDGVRDVVPNRRIATSLLEVKSITAFPFFEQSKKGVMASIPLHVPSDITQLIASMVTQDVGTYKTEKARFLQSKTFDIKRAEVLIRQEPAHKQAIKSNKDFIDLTFSGTIKDVKEDFLGKKDFDIDYAERAIEQEQSYKAKIRSDDKRAFDRIVLTEFVVPYLSRHNSDQATSDEILELWSLRATDRLDDQVIYRLLKEAADSTSGTVKNRLTRFMESHQPSVIPGLYLE